MVGKDARVHCPSPFLSVCTGKQVRAVQTRSGLVQWSWCSKVNVLPATELWFQGRRSGGGNWGDGSHDLQILQSPRCRNHIRGSCFSQSVRLCFLKPNFWKTAFSSLRPHTHFLGYKSVISKSPSCMISWYDSASSTAVYFPLDMTFFKDSYSVLTSCIDKL